MTTNELANLEEALEGLHGDDQQTIAQAALGWADLLLRKNADYGSSAWQTPVLTPGLDPRTAILVRMSDKIARLNALFATDKKAQVDESVEDTMRDLGAYALLYFACPVEK